MASAAGNATAGRELSGLSPHRRSLFSDQTALGTNIRTHADLHQHWCRPPSAPMPNRFYLFYISLFCSPLFYLWGLVVGPRLCIAPIHRPGFLTSDSGSRWQAAPWSPRWLIGLPSAPKPSRAKGISKPESLPVCQQSWRPGLSSNIQGDHTYRCPQQPPHPTTPASTPRAGPQPNPPTPRQPNSNAPPPRDSAPRWPP